jgi:hypothetical protein
VTRSLGDRGDTTHESTADAEDVDVHGFPLNAPRREERASKRAEF